MRAHLDLNERDITQLALAYEHRPPQDVLRWMLKLSGLDPA